MDLGQLIKMASSASANAASARDEALPSTVTACHMIEESLLKMLDGERLRGLKNIGISGEDWYGARVRTKPDTKIDHFNDCCLVDGHSADTFLIIDSFGKLAYLQWVLDDQDGDRDPYWVLYSSPVPDDYFRIGDVDGMLRALRVVLPRHVKNSNRATASYRKAKALASRIEAALASEGE
jgi:hypothetical protein